jgi:hypothetical protein
MEKGSQPSSGTTPNPIVKFWKEASNLKKGLVVAGIVVALGVIATIIYFSVRGSGDNENVTPDSSAPSGDYEITGEYSYQRQTDDKSSTQKQPSSDMKISSTFGSPSDYNPSSTSGQVTQADKDWFKVGTALGQTATYSQPAATTTATPVTSTSTTVTSFICPLTAEGYVDGQTVKCACSKGISYTDTSIVKGGADKYYPDSSNICRSAKHAGSLPSTNLVTFTMKPKTSVYKGSTSNDVISVDYTSDANTKASFVFDSNINIITDSDCVYDSESTWGDWSVCDSTGKQSRVKKIKTEAVGNGKKCETTETRTCIAPVLNVDCAPEDTWSDWSVCDNKCGYGNQTRTRKIKTQASGTGKACAASDLTQTQTCKGQGTDPACEPPCPQGKWVPNDSMVWPVSGNISNETAIKNPYCGEMVRMQNFYDAFDSRPKCQKEADIITTKLISGIHKCDNSRVEAQQTANSLALEKAAWLARLNAMNTPPPPSCAITYDDPMNGPADKNYCNAGKRYAWVSIPSPHSSSACNPVQDGKGTWQWNEGTDGRKRGYVRGENCNDGTVATVSTVTTTPTAPSQTPVSMQTPVKTLAQLGGSTLLETATTSISGLEVGSRSDGGTTYNKYNADPFTYEGDCDNGTYLSSLLPYNTSKSLTSYIPGGIIGNPPNKIVGMCSNGKILMDPSITSANPITEGLVKTVLLEHPFTMNDKLSVTTLKSNPPSYIANIGAFTTLNPVMHINGNGNATHSTSLNTNVSHINCPTGQKFSGFLYQDRNDYDDSTGTTSGDRLITYLKMKCKA